MKIKFSRVMAIVCALSVAFAGLTAFAATGDVTITTTYDAYKAGTNEAVEVTAKIYGQKDSEVTYYVEKNGTPVYINQYTVPDTGFATSVFKTSHNGLLSAVAKFGTDGSLDHAFPEFTFAEGTNFLTQGKANAEPMGYADMAEYTTTDANANLANDAKAFKAEVNGAAVEYGIVILQEGKANEYFAAAGCDDEGQYIVVLNGVNYTNKTVKAYAKTAADEYVISADAYVIQ